MDESYRGLRGLYNAHPTFRRHVLNSLLDGATACASTARGDGGDGTTSTVSAVQLGGGPSAELVGLVAFLWEVVSSQPQELQAAQITRIRVSGCVMVSALSGAGLANGWRWVARLCSE